MSRFWRLEAQLIIWPCLDLLSIVPVLIFHRKNFKITSKSQKKDTSRWFPESNEESFTPSEDASYVEKNWEIKRLSGEMSGNSVDVRTVSVTNSEVSSIKLSQN